MENSESFVKLDTQMDGFIETLNKISDRVDASDAQIVNIKHRLIELESQNQRLCNRVNELEISSINMQHQTRKFNNLEIRGTPLSPNENIYEVLHCTARALGLQFVRDQISIAHRIGVNPEIPYPPAIYCAVYLQIYS